MDTVICAFFGTSDGEPTHIGFSDTANRLVANGKEHLLLELAAEFSSDVSPWSDVFLKPVKLPIADDEMCALTRLILVEAHACRCGSEMVLSRLTEVLFVKCTRTQIELGVGQHGFLAGLADSRFSLALVAIHEQTGWGWRNDELALVAGLSISRFAWVFDERLGQSPQAYLRRWRMRLAHQDIGNG